MKPNAKVKREIQHKRKYKLNRKHSCKPKPNLNTRTQQNICCKAKYKTKPNPPILVLASQGGNQVLNSSAPYRWGLGYT
jgi:hypothetical protein